jgi:hypothetical protein
MIAPNFYGDKGGIANKQLVCFAAAVLFLMPAGRKHIDLILPGRRLNKRLAIATGILGYPNRIIMPGQVCRHGRFAGRFGANHSYLYYFGCGFWMSDFSI